MSHHDSDHTTTTVQTRLPIELIELILSVLWSSTLSVQIRRALLTNLPLVSRTWNSSFKIVQRLFPTPKELHIISQQHALDFIRLLRKSSQQKGPTFRTKSQVSSNSTSIHSSTLHEIESISIVIPGDSSQWEYDPQTFPRSSPMSTLSKLLRALGDCSYRLPALRILRVDFWNVPLEEAVEYAQFRHWPEGLGEVQLRIGCDEENLGGLSSGFRGGVALKRCGRGNGYAYGYVHEWDEKLRWVLRGVRNVMLVDASEDVLMRVSTAFRNAKIVCA